VLGFDITMKLAIPTRDSALHRRTSIALESMNSGIAWAADIPQKSRHTGGIELSTASMPQRDKCSAKLEARGDGAI
jgi:hypothetical protein